MRKQFHRDNSVRLEAVETDAASLFEDLGLELKDFLSYHIRFSLVFTTKNSLKHCFFVENTGFKKDAARWHCS